MYFFVSNDGVIKMDKGWSLRRFPTVGNLRKSVGYHAFPPWETLRKSKLVIAQPEVMFIKPPFIPHLGTT